MRGFAQTTSGVTQRVSPLRDLRLPDSLVRQSTVLLPHSLAGLGRALQDSAATRTGRMPLWVSGAATRLTVSTAKKNPDDIEAIRVLTLQED